jgi:stress-induced morphogen
MVTNELIFWPLYLLAALTPLYIGAFDIKTAHAYFNCVVVCQMKFEGKRAVQRRQMVYKTIGKNWDGTPLFHMICKTPAEVKQTLYLKSSTFGLLSGSSSRLQYSLYST